MEWSACVLSVKFLFCYPNMEPNLSPPPSWVNNSIIPYLGTLVQDVWPACSWSLLSSVPFGEPVLTVFLPFSIDRHATVPYPAWADRSGVRGFLDKNDYVKKPIPTDDDTASLLEMGYTQKRKRSRKAKVTRQAKSGQRRVSKRYHD